MNKVKLKTFNLKKRFIKFFFVIISISKQRRKV